MKYLLTIVSLLVLGYTLPGQKVSSSIVPDFKNCEDSKNKSQCSQEKWASFLEQTHYFVTTNTSIHFKDSINIKFRVKRNGKIKIQDKFAYFSSEALNLILARLKLLDGVLFATAKKELVNISFKFELPSKLKSIASLTELAKLPFFKNCHHFNQKARLSSIIYLTDLIAAQIPYSRDEGNVDLYFQSGQLTAIESTLPCFDIQLFDSLPSIVNQQVRKYVNFNSWYDTQDFKVSLEYNPLGYGKKLEKIRSKKLENLIQFQDKNLYINELIRQSEICYPQSKAGAAAFISFNINKTDFQNLHKIRRSNGFILDLDSIRELATEFDVNKESERDKTFRLPLFNENCHESSSNELIQRCFNRQMNLFIKENYQFPEVARKLGIQGKVYINFVVEKDGSISLIEVIRGVDPLLDLEAIRVISELPDMKSAAIAKNKPVRSRYTIPFNLKLQ